MKRTPIRRISKSETAKLQAKCDRLLTPIMKKLHPKCEVCGSDTEVAHHWIEKSRSNNLRYNIENLVPLCHSCHAKIHNRFGNSITGSLDVADIIRAKRGEEWYNRMKVEGQKVIKVNKAWYEEQLAKLTEILNCG